MKKVNLRKIILLAFLLLLALGLKNVLAQTISVEASQENRDPAKLIVKSDIPMAEIKVYRKTQDNKYILILKAKVKGSKQYESKIDTRFLSSEESRDFIVIAKDEDQNVIGSGGFTVTPIPPMTSMDPSETAKPSWTPPVIPTKPTQSIHPSEQPGPSGTGEITGIKLNKNSVTLKIGETDKLTYTVTPEGAHPHLVWRTDANEICSIEADGTIKGVSLGQATISIKADNGVMDICNVTVVNEITPSASASATDDPINTPNTIAPSGTPDAPVNFDGISIDRTKLMIDNCHYNVAELVATSDHNTPITWESSDPSIAVVNQQGVVKGLKYGKVNITASTVDPEGQTKKAVCETKVITKVTEKPSNVKSQPYNKSTGGATYYLIQGTMGKDYVEAYINNAAKLIKKYPDNENWKKEASQLTLHTYKQVGNLTIKYDDAAKKILSVSGKKYPQSSFRPANDKNFDYKPVEKPAGEMSSNDYIFFFCHQNQWEYLLKKNHETGKWECICEKESSGGYCRNEFNDYLCIFYNGPYKLMFTYRYYSKNASTWQNACHWDTGSRTGVPTSGGCIHIGKYNDEIYYRLVKEAGVGTRFILF